MDKKIKIQVYTMTDHRKTFEFDLPLEGEKLHVKCQDWANELWDIDSRPPIYIVYQGLVLKRDGILSQLKPLSVVHICLKHRWIRM